MTDLSDLKCEACSIDAPQVTDEQTSKLLPYIPEWEIVDVSGIELLLRKFKFKNFKSAWAFTNEVASFAEDQGHHPTITLEWGCVTVVWWTHKIKGLHQNDFICAAKTDVIFG